MSCEALETPVKVVEEGKKRKKVGIKTQHEKIVAQERVMEINISEMLIGFSTEVASIAKKPELSLGKKDIQHTDQNLSTEEKKSRTSRNKRKVYEESSEAGVQRASQVENQKACEIPAPEVVKPDDTDLKLQELEKQKEELMRKME